MSDENWDGLRPRLERVLELLESRLRDGDVRETNDADCDAQAYRWTDGRLEPIEHPDL